MTDSDHAQLSETFLAASDLTGQEREAFLAEACAGDDSMRESIDRMLATLDDAPSGLSRAATDIDLEAFDSLGADPETIGPYRIVRRLDAGGMGIVYEAQQDQPERSIALKVLRWVDDASQIARFELEAEVLAWLQHPAIAHVYGAGRSATPTGVRPWIAMELVQGETVDRYVRRARPSLGNVLRLVARILDGVAHAHSKGVVHRDLKPGNVIVDHDGQPKIIDFGVAQTTRDEDATAHTRAGDIVGTLAYMSPEQVRSDQAQIGTRSDIYAIGALAYELVAGERAVVPRGVEAAEAMRRVLEVDPKPLDARTGVPADVATIIHTALAKDPERRYATAETFAEDIRRFLSHEPIAARPPSALYQLRKLGRRHLGATIGLALAVTALVAGAATSTWLYVQQRRIAQERNDALLAAEESAKESARQLELSKRAVTYYGIVIGRGGEEEEGREVKLTDILDHAELEVPEDFSDAPELQARILLSFAIARYNGKQFGKALGVVEQINRLMEEFEEVSKEVRGSVFMLHASIMTAEQRPAEAERIATKAIALHQPAVTDRDVEHLSLAFTRRATARRDQNHFDGAREDVLAAMEAMEGRTLKPGLRGEILESRARLELVQGRMDEAIRWSTEALYSLEADGLGDTADACLARMNLGLALIRNRQTRLGRETLLKAATYEEAHNGPGVELSVIFRGIAQSLSMEGDNAGSRDFLQKALEGLGDAANPPSVELAMVLLSQGRLQRVQGDYETAKASFRRVPPALEGCSSFVCGLRAAQSVDLLARVCADQGNWEASREHSLKALELLEELGNAGQIEMVREHFLSRLKATDEQLASLRD